jgi:HK97 family phage prohead protease
VIVINSSMDEAIRDERGVGPEPGQEVIPAPGSVVTRWCGVEAVADDPRSTRRKRVSGSEGIVHSDRPMTFRVSVETEDRAGDVIKAEGWDLENYRQNPVVLWAHRHDLLPIGKSVDIWVENGALYAAIEFARTEFAQQIRQLFEGGFLRGVSVGFRALKVTPKRGSDGRGQKGTVFERQELLEISAAPVPMHPAALATETSTPDNPDRNDSEQRELLPLFRQLTEIWQSIAAISS